MCRWLALAVLAAACGKPKQAPPSAGSAVASGGPAGSSVAPAPVSPALPEVAGNGYAKSPPSPRVVATPSVIIVDGKQAVALEAGVVPPAAVKDRRIPALTAALSPSQEPRMVLALDKQLTFELLVQLILTFKTEGVLSYGLVAKAGADTVMLPLDLPSNNAAADSTTSLHDSAADLAAKLTGEPSSSPSSFTGAAVEVADVTLSPESSLTTSVVTTKISSTYLVSIKQCALKAAGKDASPGGTFSATLTLDETGRATQPRVTGMPKDAADCITPLLGEWRFPVAKGSDNAPVRVTATIAFKVSYYDTRNSDQSGGVRPPASAPTPRPTRTPTPAPSREVPDLGLVVSVSSTDIAVWSISGLEGTRPEPRKRWALGDANAASELSALLEDIVKRRWSGGARRADADRNVIVMAESAISIQTLAPILGAVRASQTGTELFPTILLSTFE